MVWDKYFSTHTPDQAAVRDAVRRLMNDAKYDHVIALIGAALRHQQPQPWMYEAMCLAMQAAGRPKEEIERAVMSAVDFAQTPSDLMYIGAYLMNMGYERTRVGRLPPSAAIDPLRPEPYMLGLKAARQDGQPRRTPLGKPRNPQPSVAQGAGFRLASRRGRGRGSARQAQSRKAHEGSRRLPRRTWIAPSSAIAS